MSPYALPPRPESLITGNPQGHLANTETSGFKSRMNEGMHLFASSDKLGLFILGAFPIMSSFFAISSGHCFPALRS